jgi:predicted RNA-binding Zn-ribbon protein involved in translation (DUF1610 family)
MKLEQSAEHEDLRVGQCDRCGTEIERWRGQNDLECPNCGAFYNCFGQRLRDDLHSRPNPSEWDEEIGDLEGDEMSYHLMNDPDGEPGGIDWI